MPEPDFNKICLASRECRCWWNCWFWIQILTATSRQPWTKSYNENLWKCKTGAKILSHILMWEEELKYIIASSQSQSHIIHRRLYHQLCGLHPVLDYNLALTVRLEGKGSVKRDQKLLWYLILCELWGDDLHLEKKFTFNLKKKTKQKKPFSGPECRFFFSNLVFSSVIIVILYFTIYPFGKENINVPSRHHI